jgi:hypothetical protein
MTNIGAHMGVVAPEKIILVRANLMRVRAEPMKSLL